MLPPISNSVPGKAKPRYAVCGAIARIYLYKRQILPIFNSNDIESVSLSS